MARIALVRQSKPHFEVNYTHPLGLMYLASYIRERGGHDVIILDNRIEQLSLDELEKRTLAFEPEILGLTGMTFESETVAAFSRRIREKAPHIFQVLGGVHATCFGAEALNAIGVDVTVLGEGELGFEQVVNAHVNRSDLSAVRGILFRSNGTIQGNEGRNPVENLDELPHPAWDLIPVGKYFGKRMGDMLFSRPELMSVYTSRSCPYECIYCHNLFGRGFRARSAENVLDEFSTLYHEYGIREFHVQDDIFNLDLKRAKAICRMIIESGMDIVMAFPNGMRADIMDDETIDLLYRAGTRRICYAVESASPRIQKMIKKRLDLEKVADTVRKTAKKGILVKGFFMLGFPTETREDMETTIRFAREHDFHTSAINRVIPTKGTELYQIAREMGLQTDYDYEQYSYDYSNINLSAEDDQTFERMLRKAYIRFMSRPGRILKLIWLFPNKKQIFPFYFLLLLVKLFFPKRSRDGSIKGVRRHWWTIRY